MKRKKSNIGSSCVHSTNGMPKSETTDVSDSIESRIRKGENFTLQDLQGIEAKPLDYIELIKVHSDITNRIYKVLCLNKGKEENGTATID